MKRKSYTWMVLKSRIVLFLFLTIVVSANNVAVAIEPGEELSFTNADGGATECRRLNTARGCNGVLNPFTANYDTSSNTVDASFDGIIATGIGLPNIASASIYNNFSLSGSPDNFVDVQISVTYDFQGSLFGGAAYETAVTVILKVEDITGSANKAIGSLELFRQDRSGDQGLTDLSVGGERYSLKDESAKFLVKLRRGRDYRIWFSVEALVEKFLVGKASAYANATRKDLTVRVDEDEVELMATNNETIDRTDKRQIEENLEAKNMIVSLILPEEHGGQLEAVIDLVETLIYNSENAGFDTKKSKFFFNRALLAFDNSKYKLSYTLLTKAYDSLVPSHKTKKHHEDDD